MQSHFIALMIEAASTSETSVNFYQTTRCYNSEDSHLRTHRRENFILHFSLVRTFKTGVNKNPFNIIL
jgi:hypothetical protein